MADQLMRADLMVMSGDEFRAGFSVTSRVGEGAYSTVYQCSHAGEQMALKVLKDAARSGDAHSAAEVAFFREARALKACQHRNVVGFRALVRAPLSKPDGRHKQRWAILQELMTGGTLRDVVFKQMLRSGAKGYTLEQALKWAADIAAGVQCCHSAVPLVIHRDLKLENVLLTRDRTAKLSDFGLHARVDPGPDDLVVEVDASGRASLSFTLPQGGAQAAGGQLDARDPKAKGVSRSKSMPAQVQILASDAGSRASAASVRLTTHALRRLSLQQQQAGSFVPAEASPAGGALVRAGSSSAHAGRRDGIDVGGGASAPSGRSSPDASSTWSAELHSWLAEANRDPNYEVLLAHPGAQGPAHHHRLTLFLPKHTPEDDKEPLPPVESDVTARLDAGGAPAVLLHPAVLHYDMTSHTGSFMYMAPEMYLGLPYDEKVDIFSLGCMIYELVARVLLLASETRADSPSDCEAYARKVAQGYRPKKPAAVPADVWAIIEACWAQAPSARPSAAQVLARVQVQLQALHSGSGGGGGYAAQAVRPRAPCDDARCGCSVT